MEEFEKSSLVADRTSATVKQQRHRKILSDPSQVYKLAIITMIAISVVYSFQGYYRSLIGSFSNIIQPLIAGVMFVTVFRCVKKYGFGFRDRFRRIWSFFSLAATFWLLAQITWAYYYFAKSVDVPYPSAADIFYIAAYLPLFLALLSYFRLFSPALSGRRLTYSIIGILTSITLVLGFVLPTEFAVDPASLDAITDLAYPILNLVLLSLAIMSLTIFAGGSIGKWWIHLAAGIVLFTIGDELFQFEVAQGTYYNGIISDAILTLGGLLFVVAFYIHSNEL